MEQGQIELIVRLTARMSAAAFAIALVPLSFSTGHRQRRVRRGVQCLAAFIIAHTIHFGAVVWLAAMTNGANIEERGGWLLAVTVAGLFYLFAFGILRLWRGFGSGRGARFGERFIAHAGVALIALVFLNSYAARVQEMPVYWLPTIGMVAIVSVYFVRARVTIADVQHSAAAVSADSSQSTVSIHHFSDS